jgi:hypothetical protein
MRGAREGERSRREGGNLRLIEKRGKKTKKKKQKDQRRVSEEQMREC